MFLKIFIRDLFLNKHYPTDMLVRSFVIYKLIWDYWQMSYIGSTTLQFIQKMHATLGNIF